MKTINVHNYKEYAIDYMIGNLSAQDAEAFTLFLSKHPDIADEVLLFETDAPGQPCKKSFSNLKKDISLQNITDDNFEEYCIANLEGDLDTDGKKRLKKFIGDKPERKNTQTLFEHTKLAPDNIVYPHKESLKKTVRQPLWGRRFIRISTGLVAASVIAFGLFFILPKQNNQTTFTATNQTSHEKEDTIQKSNKKMMVSPQHQSQSILAANTKSKPANKSDINKKQDITIPVSHDDKGISNTNDILVKLKHKNVNIPENAIAMGEIELIESPPTTTNNIEQLNFEEENNFRNIANKLLFSKVFAQGVKSINKMAESDLEYDVIKDKDGNPVRVIVKSRLGEINHELAQR